jgi:hypothetical protein
LSSGYLLRPRRRRVSPKVVLATGVLVAAVVIVPWVLRSGGSIAIDGLDNNAVLGSSRIADLSITIVPHGVSGKSLKATLDGHALPVDHVGTAYTVHPTGLGDGKHTLVVSASGGHLFGNTKASRHFIVDTTPPALRMNVPTQSVSLAAPVTLSGTVESGATVTAEGGTVSLNGTKVSIRYAHPPLGSRVVAKDAAGNSTVREITVPTAYPQQVRGVHMTGYAWASSTLRKPILALARAHRINTIELDIKEEDGIVDFDPHVPLATRIHAIIKKYDPAAVVRQLHHMGVRVMGRIVAFNDPKLGAWAWKHHHHDWVIQKPNHHRYVYGYAKSYFTNFANANVRDYNIALGKAAVRAGFDDIVYDYIRRPDGDIRSMRFPGIKNSQAEDGVVGFTREAAQQMHAMGASVGATIFAQAALPHRAVETAQNVPRMAHYLDAVMPMDYPSHWAAGEFGIANPHKNVYAIVHKSLKYWIRAVHGTNCKVVPWLQDEDYLGRYTAPVVRREIQGARDDGLPGWVMWSAIARYTTQAFDPNSASALRTS